MHAFVSQTLHSFLGKEKAALPLRTQLTERAKYGVGRRRWKLQKIVCSESPSDKDPPVQGAAELLAPQGDRSNVTSGNGVHAETREKEPSDAELQSKLKESAVDAQEGESEVSDREASEAHIPLKVGPLSLSIPPRWLLYSVPFFWGSFGPAVRLLYEQERHPDPSVYSSARLLLSLLVYLPILVQEFNAFRNRNSPSAEPNKSFAFLPAGIELGVYVFLANVAQVVGLQQTSASRAAFLGQLQTVFVPVITGLLGVDKITPKTWLSSLVAVVGVAFLSADKGHGTVSTLTGDGLVVLSAAFFSAYIIRLSKFCDKIPANPLVATKIAVQALLSTLWAAADIFKSFQNVPTDLSASQDVAPWTLGTVLISVGVILWTGLLSSAASGWAQTKGQRGVPASEAVIIFASQPLWAGALAAVVLGETFGVQGFAGGALIVAATLIAGQPNKEDGKTKES